ncbi:hypothetical protein BDZ45DRAFT_303899 [Acephala macrosclerotiorum]|nr:hypothetical protein BDZ45DRAFT_303899 [Acephala macrosclerotiorum]
MSLPIQARPDFHTRRSISLNLPQLKPRASNSDTMSITPTLSNTCSVSGKGVVQVYFVSGTLLAMITEQPIKCLVGFKKLEVGAGKSVSVTIEVEMIEPGHYASSKSRVNAGTYASMMERALAMLIWRVWLRSRSLEQHEEVDK